MRCLRGFKLLHRCWSGSCGIYIPGNVQVVVPHLIIMSDERYFSKAEEF
jgi:hypothetical protein